jgi:hypothetical protein
LLNGAVNSSFARTGLFKFVAQKRPIFRKGKFRRIIYFNKIKIY